jgi:phthalate 4,5-cis-dihydrodiol dehydrogenase
VIGARVLRIGVAGLSRAFALMVPTFRADPRVALVGGADPRLEARQRFAEDFGGHVYPSVDALCADPDVEVVYVASPHQLHAEHAIAAASHGKHVLVEKPMALTLADCRAMIDAAARADVRLMIGHSHSYDAPYVRARELIAAGTFGGLHMITALNFTDFLYRPRRPEELDTSQGGGAVLNQGAHHVDVARLLAGARVRTVRALTGAWDRARPTEGAYSALLTFENGVFATLVYSGYGHFDSDELVGNIGELGAAKDGSTYGRARAALRAVASPSEEGALKMRRAYGTAGVSDAAPAGHNHFGMVVASCDAADLRPLATGIMIYGDEQAWLEPLTRPVVPRVEVIDELYAAVVQGRRILHGGAWGMATVEVCLAMLESARTGRDVPLAQQVAADE